MLQWKASPPRIFEQYNLVVDRKKKTLQSWVDGEKRENLGMGRIREAG